MDDDYYGTKGHFYTHIVLAIIFIVWGILSYFEIVFGSYWIAIAGVFIIYSAIEHYYRYKSSMNLVANVLKSSPIISMAQLKEETGMKEHQLKKVIRYLKAEGRLKSTFDPQSGDLVVYEVDGIPVMGQPGPYPPAAVPMQSQMQPQMTSKPEPTVQDSVYSQKFCPYCGTIVPKDAKFCPTCGASLTTNI